MMKKTLKAIIATVVMAVVSCVHGFSLPIVGTGTDLNKWSRNISGVLAAAKTTGYPIFLVMINDSSSGEGCSHCKYFVERTLNTSEFDAIVRDYKFYMVLLNYWGADTGSSQPNYGGVSSSIFMQNFYKYASDGGYPVVAVLRPNGTKYKGWGDTTTPGTRGTILHQYIRQAIADLSTTTTKFELSAESGNTVTVQFNGSTVQPGTWKGIVKRSGSSGATGSVAISLSGANAAQYSLSTTSLAWDASDGSKSFTVTGPSSAEDGIISDTLTVKIAASGFDGSDISYGVTSQTVTFKDSRVKQSLDEFAAANSGLQGLKATEGVWFVPASGGNVLETLTASSSTLEFTATAGGILTVSVGANNPGTMEATANGQQHELAGGEPLRFGVAAGQKITFKATAPEEAEGAVATGFTKFSFSPLTVAQRTPANGAQISYSEMVNDKTKADLEWTASLDGCTFALVYGGTTTEMDSAMTTNAIDLGFVSMEPATKSYTWQVKASYANEDLIGTAVGTASATFTVAAVPSFGNLPAKITAYKSIDASLDLSVAAVGAGTVTYSATGLPNGLKINKTTGVISGSSKRTGTYSVTVTAKNEYGEASTTVPLSLDAMPKTYTKATYVCFGFSDAGDVKAVAEIKLKASGKWTAKFSDGGRTTSYSGRLTSLLDGTLALVAGNALNLVFDGASGMWSGTSYGRTVYGKAVDKADATWTGTWNIGVGTSSSATLGGWVTAKVNASGQVSFSGSVSNSLKIKGKGYSAVFPASFVAANLPRWAGHGDVRFAHMVKADGGCAFCSDGTLGGNLTLRSVAYDEFEGAKWMTGSIDALDGATFKTTGGGNIEIPIKVSGNKLSVGKNAYEAEVKVTAKSGAVKASYKNGSTKCKATGVLYKVNGALKAVGGGSAGADPFAFVIE